MKRLGLLVLIGYTASASVAHAATYYVAKSGSDSNTCTHAQNVNTPKLTVAAGLVCMSGGGDTLLIRTGTYNERITRSPSGTSWSSKVRIANYNGETVWLDILSGENALRLSSGEQYIEFDGINMRTHTINGVISLLSGVHHIRVQNAEIETSTGSSGGSGGVWMDSSFHEFINLTVHGIGGPYGFYIGGSNNLVERCNVYDVAMGGIHVYSTAAVPTNNVIRNTRIYNITQSFFFGKPDSRMFGIFLSGNNNQVYNNLIYDLSLPGTTGTDGQQNAIVVYTGSGNKIWNNTVTNNRALGIKLDSAASNTEVRNNIAWSNAGSAFQNNGSNTQQSDNLFGTDPLFANPSARDFQLTAASRAVDAGAIVSAVTSDLSGVARPQGSRPDIGAYEYRGQTAAPGPPAPPTGVRIVSN